MENYELEEKNFRKLLKRILLLGLTGTVLVGGYEYLNSQQEPEKISSNKKPVIEETAKEEKVTRYQDENGVIYMAPEGCYLVDFNGEIRAVREFKEVVDAYKSVAYTAPDGYILDGRKATRTYYDTIELTPINTVDGKVVYAAPAGYIIANIAGKICGVKVMTETIDAPIVVTYTAPAGYSLDGKKAVRVLKQFVAPIILYEDHTTFGK